MSELLQYKCPNCGGGVVFDSTSQKMKCQYCDTEFERDTIKQYDAEVNKKDDNLNWSDNEAEWSDEESLGFKVYVCESCGGEVVAEDTTAASSCPFCGNAIVVKSNLSGMLKPDIIVPFKLDREQAKKALKAFYKGKRLLPKLFAQENHIDEIKGVYVPFWLYSCGVDASVKYRTTRTRAWSDRRYNYVETSHYLVTREGNVAYANVPVDGSSKMPDNIMESIEPFNINEAVDFQTGYLSGFLADKYDVTSEICKDRANDRIKVATEGAFASTVHGYSSVVPESTNISLSNAYVKYGLLPVWMLTTKWKDKSYVFAMNGQSGKFVGDLPVDRGLFWKYFAVIFAVASAVAFGISMLL